MENLCLQLDNVEISMSDKVILNIPSLKLYQFDRIGIVGKNGAGKSTLLKILNGQIQPEKGQVKRFIDFAYFDQLNVPTNHEVEYELKGKLSIPNTEIGNFSGGELTRLKLPSCSRSIMKDYY